MPDKRKQLAVGKDTHDGEIIDPSLQGAGNELVKKTMYIKERNSEKLRIYSAMLNRELSSITNEALELFFEKYAHFITSIDLKKYTE